MRFFGFIILLLSINISLAQPTLSVETYATGFFRPLKVVNAGDDRLFIIEQPGQIKIIDADGNTLPNSFLDIRSRVNDGGNEQGLLGLAFPPDYAESGVFYVNYTGGNGSGFTRVSRFKVDPTNPNIALEDSEEILLVYNQPYFNHNGGDMNFGPDGYLYWSSGDGGSGDDPQNMAQNKDSYLGKIFRIDVDTEESYNIPADNPFVGQANVKEEIWSYGLRNPWRFSFDRKTNDMWIGDVGQSVLEEVDFEPAGFVGGANYGWKCYEGTNFYNPNPNPDPCTGDDYIEPIFEYPHNTTTGGFSITGGYVYRGEASPELKGNYICADYLTGNFWMISSNDETNEWMTFRQNDLLDNVVGFGEDINGKLYITTLNGSIYTIAGDCPDSTVMFDIVFDNDTLFAETTAKDIVWYMNGNVIEGANEYFYVPGVSGTYQSSGIANVNGCHYEATSNVFELIDCGDTILDVTLVLENDTLKSNISSGTFTWYLDGEVIDEEGSFHIPLFTGEYYVEVTQEFEDCTFFGVSDTVLTECDEVLCDAVIVLQNDTLFAQCVFGTVTWFLNGNQIAVTNDDEDAFFIPTESGEYSIYSYDSIAPYCVIIREASLDVVINSIFNQSTQFLSIHPNPASSNINFQIKGKIDLVNVYSVEGKEINVSYRTNQNNVVVDIQQLPKGVYLLNVEADSKKYSGKFVKE